ncbi:MAG: hypothetical protein IT518_13635 [Burkholderiales bacterium]|nr:hypothetical protein [Burkholderiales bacterium]
MTLLRRLLLLVLVFALPLQGAMAASRLCMGTAHHGADATSAAHASGAHAAGAPHRHDGSDAASAPASDDPSPATDHASSTCKHCAACCLTVAVAPPPPAVAPGAAGFASFHPIAVPVPHNVADGLERPPRTI